MAFLTTANITDYMPDDRIDAMFAGETSEIQQAVDAANGEVERRTGILQTDATYGDHDTLRELAASVFKFRNMDRVDMMPDHVVKQWTRQYKDAVTEMQRISGDKGRLKTASSETTAGSKLAGGHFQRQITDRFI